MRSKKSSKLACLTHYENPKSGSYTPTPRLQKKIGSQERS
jgi:hypothetical protein